MDRKKFSVRFLLKLPVQETKFLELEYTSEFETDPEFDSEFENSHWAKANAPAIAFPFVRSYVAHITLIAGYEPVILPSRKFTIPPNP